MRGGGGECGARAILKTHAVGGLAKPFEGGFTVGGAGELTPGFARDALKRAGLAELGREGGWGGDAEETLGQGGTLQKSAATAGGGGLSESGGPVDAAALNQPRDIDQPEETEPAVTRAVLEKVEGIEVGRQRAHRPAGDLDGDEARGQSIDRGQAFEAPEQLESQRRLGADVLVFGFEPLEFLKLPRGEREVGARAAEAGGLKQFVGAGDVDGTDDEIDVTDVATAGTAMELLSKDETLDRERLDAGGGETLHQANLVGGLSQGAMGDLSGESFDPLSDRVRA